MIKAKKTIVLPTAKVGRRKTRRSTIGCSEWSSMTMKKARETAVMTASQMIRPEAEPVLPLALVEHDLEASEADHEEGEAPGVDLHLRPLHVRRIDDEEIGHDDRDDAEGDVYEEYPVPGPVVRDPAPEQGSDYGTGGYPHAEDRRGHAHLSDRKGFDEDCLRQRLQGSSPYALHDAEEDQALQVPGKAAHQRAHGEEDMERMR